VRALELLGSSLLVLLCVLGLGAGAAWLVGYTPLVDRSDSMSPTLHAGDLLITRRFAAVEAHPGQVVTFRDEALGGRSVTHRVVRVARNGDRLAFTTRGDANRSTEDWTIRPQAELSRVVWRAPLVGSVALWAMSPLVRLLLAGLGCGLLSWAALRRIWSTG
jgi:signal peptidase I